MFGGTAAQPRPTVAHWPLNHDMFTAVNCSHARTYPHAHMRIYLYLYIYMKYCPVVLGFMFLCEQDWIHASGDPPPPPEADGRRNSQTNLFLSLAPDSRQCNKMVTFGSSSSGSQVSCCLCGPRWPAACAARLRRTRTVGDPRAACWCFQFRA